MSMKINTQDFYAGVLFIVVGIAFAIGATNYNIGVAANMGPGYFPLVLGTILAVIGTIITFKSIITKVKYPVGPIAWRPLIFIITANIAFGLSITSGGLISGIYALTFIAAFAGDNFKFKEIFILATILSVSSYFVFIKLIKLQLEMWPAFIVG